MEMMNPKDVKKSETFTKLFPIKEELLQTIAKDMRDNKYDLSQPVIIATWTGQDGPVCIDGHTRLEAAMMAGIQEVPVWLREFSTEDEAIDYAIHLQRDRRNMTDAELMACISALDQRRERGGNRRTEEARSNTQDCVIEKPKSSSKETAEKLGISARKVEQARTIEDHADPDVKEAVQSGEMSINKAYNETQKRRKESKGEPVQAQPQNSETEDEVDESQQDTTVKLLERHYTSLLELGGSVDDHVAWAIDMYLSSDSQGNYQHTTTVAL